MNMFTSYGTLGACLALIAASPLQAAENTGTEISSESEISTSTESASAAREPINAAAVENAIEEYVRAKYAGDAEGVRARAHNDISRRLVMNTFWGERSDEWVRPYTHDQLKFYGTDLNETKRDDPENGRCEITVFDVARSSASAVVIMEDVVDYLHMIHFDGKWIIADSAVILLNDAGDKPPPKRDAKKKDIEPIVRDYCIGFYELDGDKVQGTCHPILSKRSIEHAQGTDFDYLSRITYEEINLLGETFNRHYGFDPETARCEIEIYEVRKNVAAAKLTGGTWFDYFHLLRVNGEWQIVNIIYEPLPRDQWDPIT